MPAGRLQGSLSVLLTSLPGVQTVAQVNGISAARAALAQAAPHLLILDWDLWDRQAEALLREARARSPRPYCVALVGGESQQAAAWQAGLEAVLLKGFSARDMEAVVRRCTAPAGQPEAAPGGPAAGAMTADE
jgi:DNA-binding response OmpR family regulator